MPYRTRIWRQFNESAIVSIMSAPIVGSAAFALPPENPYGQNIARPSSLFEDLTPHQFAERFAESFESQEAYGWSSFWLGPKTSMNASGAASRNGYQSLSWLQRLGVQTLFIEPGSPWENGCNESFNAPFRVTV